VTLRPWVSMARPFTLLPPLLGILSGSACAFGSSHNLYAGFTPGLFWTIVLGSVCASLMNAASNIINQVYDLDIDRVNKPQRPLCTGAVTVRQAVAVSWAMYVASIAPIWWIVPPPYNADLASRTSAPWHAHACFWIYLGGLLCTFVYSAPGLGRTKRLGLWANATIALARGELLKVAGWAFVATVTVAEPWYLGAVFFFFLLGASSTKDFSDMEGDRRGGCRTLPVAYGPKKAAWMIASAFVFPWLLFPLGIFLPAPEGTGRLLTGSPLLLSSLGAGLILWGMWTVYLLLRDPDELARTENHPSWTHMYAMMMAAQVGLGLAYLL
jgi:geranylgeranylglycerol-phosphate geranylgeranyltransferase